MEITKHLTGDIIKIQTELITAIQNHQVLVLRQGVNPSDSVKTQIEEVQRHIICLGESQKILVTRLKSELESQSLREKNQNNETPTQQFTNKSSDVEKCKDKANEVGRSLLVKHMNSKDTTLKPANPSDGSDNFSERKSTIPKERPSLDSSSEENRTPCASPANANSDCESRGLKRPSPETHIAVKRVKTTLQATPRPSSPALAANDALSSSSEESLDSMISRKPEVERKIEFAHSLGLITQDVYNKVINKKFERRKRKISHNHHLYNDLWDLTVIQKRIRLKEPVKEETEDVTQDCNSAHSDTDSLCFVCRKPGDLEECRVCQTGCHVTCIVANVCPACTHQSCPIITEKKKELEQLRLKNKELHKSVAKLRERAKVLSASLVTQTATVNQLSAKEDKLHESIKKIKDFIAHFQGSKPSS